MLYNLRLSYYRWRYGATGKTTRRLAAHVPLDTTGWKALGVLVVLAFLILGVQLYVAYAARPQYRALVATPLEVKRDPIIVLRSQMQQEGLLTDDDFAKLDEELKAIVQDAWDFADQSPEPPVEALYEDVLVDTTSDAPAEAAVAAD